MSYTPGKKMLFAAYRENNGTHPLLQLYVLYSTPAAIKPARCPPRTLPISLVALDTLLCC